MPAVSVPPPLSSALETFRRSSHSAPAMQNGLSRSITEIKEKAKEDARKAARGASAMSLIKFARVKSLNGQECELSGDLRGALNAYITSGTLAQMAMETVEYKMESQPGKKGVLFKEFFDFSQSEGNLKQRVEGLTAKLEELERSSSTLNGTDHKPGGSIADRMRSLQDAGLSVSTTKRFSREISMPPTPPMSPDVVRNRFSNSNLSSASASASSNLPFPSTSASNSTAPSPHAFVPLSSLGPPSPTSSPPSSPQTSSYSLTEFSQAFPSIDELNELDELQLPSVPVEEPGSSRVSPTTRDTRRDATIIRNFPILSVDPSPRPSSTPNTPTINSFASRPASPTIPPLPSLATGTPISPTIPIPIPKKPSMLGLSVHSPEPSTPVSAQPDKHILPMTNQVEPKMLHELMYQPGYKVLFVDVRNREYFDREHIKADAVVCIEPSVLLRESVSGASIEDAMSVAPRDEGVLFKNRDKFDLIAIYDDSSKTFEPAPLSSLVRAIYELAFRRILKRIPVLIVGGIEAWKREIGNEGVVASVAGGGIVAEPKKKEAALTESLAVLKPQPPPPPISVHPPLSDPSRYWTPPAHDMRDRAVSTFRDDELRYSLPPPTRSAVDMGGYGNSYSSTTDSSSNHFSRKNIPTRPSANSMSSSRPLPEPTGSSIPQSMINGTSSIQYPQFPRMQSPGTPGSPYSSSVTYGLVSPPPQASINPTLSRRRSDYIDQSQEAVSGIVSARPPVDYPDLASRQILRLPPAAASPTMERQDNRPRLMRQDSLQGGSKPPTIQSDYPVTYWSDTQISTSGLKNLGNTCYMNATIQCLSATVPFARFFADGRWRSAVNMVNPMGTKGNLAKAFADILHEMWQADLPSCSPYIFRRSITAHASQFGGSDQHDSQEFLSFLLDGLHEDLNRVLHKPTWVPTPEREAELERIPQQIASDQEWKIYRMRNDSLIVDFFQGQFRNRLQCQTCSKTSTTYNSFMYLTLPVPPGRNSKVTLTQCLDSFVKEEVMEKTDAWHCPSCKTLRRATKQLSLSRLPPVLLIHLKRFSVKGPFTDKIETLVDFPLRSLDLTNYMPMPLPPGVDKSQLNGGHRMSSSDPRAQLPPYKYDLYGVTNHSGNLSNGHYTAFIASRGGWIYCDDSRVQQTDAKEVVGRRAYVLFYKRTKS